MITDPIVILHIGSMIHLSISVRRNNINRKGYRPQKCLLTSPLCSYFLVRNRRFVKALLQRTYSHLLQAFLSPSKSMSDVGRQSRPNERQFPSMYFQTSITRLKQTKRCRVILILKRKDVSLCLYCSDMAAGCRELRILKVNPRCSSFQLLHVSINGIISRF